MSTRKTQANSTSSMANDESHEHFTAVEFLKGILSFEQNNGNLLILHNQNTTIASVFYTNAITKLNENSKNTTASRTSLLIENLAATSSTLTFAGYLMQSIQVPVVQLNELHSFYLKRQLGERLLSIVYIDINIESIQKTLSDHRGLLQKLSMNLLHITTTKVLFLLNFHPLARQAVGVGTLLQSVVVRLFQFCWQQKIINVIALLADYQTTRTFYSYTHFPEFQLEIKTIALNPEEQEDIFPYRLRNLFKHKLPIAIGGSDPRIIPLKTSIGQLVVGGFVGHLLEAFAKKYNCILTQPIQYKPQAPIPSQDLIMAVRNGSIEISAGLTFPEIPLHGYSYPYEQLNWCIMLPVEADVPNYKFFTLVFKGETYVLVISSLLVISMLLSAALYVHGHHPDILDLICHDDCLRGLLGQTFSEIANPPQIIRFIYLQICILGILLTTTYNSYYSTYVTSPPKEASVNNIDDILLFGLKIIAWRPEYMELMGRATEFKKYTSIFALQNNYKKYLQMRDSFDTKFGYAVPTTKWTIVQEQQKIFTTPLFRLSPIFCFFNNIPMCFPVHENSIFNSLLYQLMLESAQSGLTNYWCKNGFWELIMNGKLNLVDLSKKQEFESMKVHDLFYVFIFMGSMLILATLVFLGEVVVFYQKNILHKTLKLFVGKTRRN